MQTPDERPPPPPSQPADTAATPAKPPAAPGGPLRAVWYLLQPVLLVALLLALVVAGGAGGAAWLLRSEDGSRWLLARVPGVDVQGLQGALLSERFAAERLVIRWGTGGQQSVAIDGLRAEGMHWQWHPAPGAWLGLKAASLQARKIDVQTGPPGPQPPTLLAARPASTNIAPHTEGIEARMGRATSRLPVSSTEPLVTLPSTTGPRLR